MASFPERLKELRKAKGISQKALGEFVGSSERGIQSYELEERKPTLEIINKLADYFEVSTDYLLGRTNFSVDADGNIKVKTPPDIFSDEDKKRIIKGLSKPKK